MLRRVVVLLLLVSMLAVTIGCTTPYNASNLSRANNVRRMAIAGEQIRLLTEDVDRVLGLHNYPLNGRYAR
jgi:hypothetical protein